MPEKAGAPPILAEPLLLAAITFGPVAFASIDPWARAAQEILIVSLVLACGLRRALDLRAPIHRTLLPAVAGILAIAAAQGLHPRAVLDHGWTLTTIAPFATRKDLFLWASYAALLLVVPVVIDTEARLRRLAWTLFLLGGFVAMAGIAQGGPGQASLLGLRSSVRGMRAFGPYYHYNHAASLLAMSFLIGWGIFLSRCAVWKAGRGAAAWIDWLSEQFMVVGLMALIAYALFLTGSRGANFSALLGLLIVASLSDWREKTLKVALIVAAPVFIGVGYYFHRQAGSRFDLDLMAQSAAVRGGIYRCSFKLLEEFPLGVGLGGFKSAFSSRCGEIVANGSVPHAFNDWLELGVEAGWAGALLFIGGLAAYGGHVWRIWRKRPSAQRRCLLVGFIGAAAAFLAHGFVDYNFHIVANAFVFLTITAALSSPAFEPADAAASRVPASSAAQAAFCVAALSFVVCAWPPISGAWYFHKAETSPLGARANILSQALRWDPDPEYSYKTAQTYLEIQEHLPLDGRPLREALRYADAALSGDPLNVPFKNLRNYILWRIPPIPAR